jgi:ATP-dependent DNA helicase RecG
MIEFFKSDMEDIMYNDKRWFDIAIEKMGESIDEIRSDGKVNPKVAAILVFPDNEFVYATRGELRNGNHAEYTLLERKLINRDCSKGVLYVTLEPCAPGARQEPKRSCAEWIVSARIKKVFVGIQDPDPNVSGEGIKHLQENGVEVELFDKASQQKIIKINEKFIEDTKKREKTEGIKVAEHYLKSFIQINRDEIDTRAIALFLKQMNNKGADFFKYIIDLHQAREERGIFEISKNFYVLFSKKPSIHMPQAVIILSCNRNSGDVLRETYDGSMLLAVNSVMKWIMKNLPQISRIIIERNITPIFPEKVIREALVNAIIHRDYSIEGAKIQIIIDPNKLLIKSPGQPTKPITLEQLNNFSAPQLSRNPFIASVFREVKFCEESKLGMDTFKKMPTEYQLPRPTYEYNDPMLDITFSFDRSEAQIPLNVLNTSEQKTYNEILKHEWIGSSELSETLSLDNRTIQRHIGTMLKNGFIETNGEDEKSKNLRYRVTTSST